MYKIFCLSLVLLIVLLAAAGFGELQLNPVQAAAQSSDKIAVSFKEFKLSNGLRVLLSEDQHAPTYSICVTYNVG